MSARVSSIAWVRAREYEVAIDVEGATRRCICRVSEQDGVRFVEAVPDFLATLAVSPRLIAAAVLAVDAANEAFEVAGS
jgi:hypothetical protein